LRLVRTEEGKRVKRETSLGYTGDKESGIMNAIEGITCWDKLRLRAIEVERTIKHLEKERQEVEENTEWIDRAAYEGRVRLLDGLTTLYRDEMEQIDRAHSRVEEGSYGLCLACHKPVGANRLEIYPAAQFCFACQDYRDRLTVG
jgi:DnaK suppressor protein